MSKLDKSRRINRPRLARLKRGEIAPVFQSLFGDYPAEPTPNPLDAVEYPGELEADATQEVSAALAAILAERRKRRDAFRLMAETEYWFCVCFQSRQQKDEFLKAAGWYEHGDKYLDGLWVAEQMGIKVEAIPLPAREGTTKIPRLLRTEVLK